MSIGAKIKRVRELKNMKQETLADKLSMSPSGYGKIERDETDLPYSRLEQIAKAFSMKTEELVGFDENCNINVINNTSNTIDSQNFYNNQDSGLERELFLKTIKLLEEKIAYIEIKK